MRKFWIFGFVIAILGLILTVLRHISQWWMALRWIRTSSPHRRLD